MKLNETYFILEFSQTEHSELYYMTFRSKKKALEAAKEWKKNGFVYVEVKEVTI